MRFNTLWGACIVVCAAAVQAQTFSPSQRPKLANGYTRYVSPSECLADARREMLDVWRGFTFRDTLVYTAVLKQEPSPPSTLRAARQCLAHLQTVKIQPPQYIAMFQLALLAQREDVMTQFLDSALAGVRAEQDAQRRAWLVLRLIEAYFPDLLGMSEEWSVNDVLRYPESLARLLSLVPCTDVFACDRRGSILSLLRRDARARGNFTAASMYSDSLISMERERNQLPETEREETGRLHVFPRTSFFYGFARWYDDTTLATGSIDAPLAWKRVRSGLVEVGDNLENPLAEYAVGHRHFSFVDSLFRLGVPVKFPALTPSAWVGRAGTASAPAPGRVLLIFARNKMLGFADRGMSFPAVTAMARRLHAKYATSGFDIVWVVESRGHLNGSSVLSFDEEQKALATYWFDHHKVPGIIALDQTTFSRRPDKKLMPQTISVGVTPALAALSARAGGMMGGTYIMDRSGNLITPAIGIDIVGRDAELALERMIERALGKGRNP